MKRDQYCFTIGYNGGDAIVDKRAMQTHRKKSPRELADEGLFKSALSAALYDGKREDQEYVLSQFNEKSRARLSNVDTLKKVLGVISSWNEITTVRYV